MYYATFPISEQAEKGKWNFELQAVYTIAILDFIFDHDKDDPDKYRYNVKLSDIDTCEVFYDKLTFIYLQMPKFNKGVEELETRFEKWMYVLKHLPDLDAMPTRIQDRIFEKLFDTAALAKFTSDQMLSYEGSLKYYRDLNNVIDTAFGDGMGKGLEKGEQIGLEKGEQIGLEKGEQIGLEKGEQIGLEKGEKRGAHDAYKRVIIELASEGMTVKTMAKITGLSVEKVKKILESEP